jgi:hypothetical protein
MRLKPDTVALMTCVRKILLQVLSHKGTGAPWRCNE